MRASKILLIVFAVALFVGLSVSLIWGAPKTVDTRYYRPDEQAIKYRTTEVSTSSATFSPIPGLRNLLILNRGPVTASVSAVFKGAPVEIRVRQEGSRSLRPGAVDLDPRAAGMPFSFDFIDLGNKDVGCRTYSAEWRSPSGELAKLTAGDFIVTYKHDDETKEGLTVGCA